MDDFILAGILGSMQSLKLTGINWNLSNDIIWLHLQENLLKARSKQ